MFLGGGKTPGDAFLHVFTKKTKGCIISLNIYEKVIIITRRDKKFLKKLKKIKPNATMRRLYK